MHGKVILIVPDKASAVICGEKLSLHNLVT